MLKFFKNSKTHSKLSALTQRITRMWGFSVKSNTQGRNSIVNERQFEFEDILEQQERFIDSFEKYINKKKELNSNKELQGSNTKMLQGGQHPSKVFKDSVSPKYSQQYKRKAFFLSDKTLISTSQINQDLGVVNIEKLNKDLIISKNKINCQVKIILKGIQAHEIDKLDYEFNTDDSEIRINYMKNFVSYECSDNQLTLLLTFILQKPKSISHSNMLFKAAQIYANLMISIKNFQSYGLKFRIAVWPILFYRLKQIPLDQKKQTENIIDYINNEKIQFNLKKTSFSSVIENLQLLFKFDKFEESNSKKILKGLLIPQISHQQSLKIKISIIDDPVNQENDLYLIKIGFSISNNFAKQNISYILNAFQQYLEGNEIPPQNSIF